jgi:hypothetical protein
MEVGECTETRLASGTLSTLVISNGSLFGQLAFRVRLKRPGEWAMKGRDGTDETLLGIKLCTALVKMDLTCYRISRGIFP